MPFRFPPNYKASNKDRKALSQIPQDMQIGSMQIHIALLLLVVMVVMFLFAIVSPVCDE